MTPARPYIGRFAPSPTGPLHAGSLVAAFGSWLDARAHAGQWLIRIEDVDRPRCPPGADHFMLLQLARCGLLPDAPPLWQSQRGVLYTQALAGLQQTGWAFGCGCSRKEVAAMGHGLVYPGTCRDGLHGRPLRAWRLRSSGPRLHWHDRRLGPQSQQLDTAVGDFVLQRADGLWAYQLAVVVDDAAQRVTDIVRGADLADNTPRQIRLQQLLGLPLPRYLHLPLVLASDGEKLSKQNGAQAVDLSDPAAALREAGRALGLCLQAAKLGDLQAEAVEAWRALYGGPELV